MHLHSLEDFTSDVIDQIVDGWLAPLATPEQQLGSAGEVASSEYCQSGDETADRLRCSAVCAAQRQGRAIRLSHAAAPEDRSVIPR